MHGLMRRAVRCGKGAYGHAVRIGTGIDKGVGLARRAYGIMSPVMKELGVDTSHADKSVKALGSSYDSLRSQVSKVHEAGRKIGGL